MLVFYRISAFKLTIEHIFLNGQNYLINCLSLLANIFIYIILVYVKIIFKKKEFLKLLGHLIIFINFQFTVFSIFVRLNYLK